MQNLDSIRAISVSASGRPQKGAIVVWLSVVLFVASLALAYGAPRLQRHQRELRARATLESLHRFETAFEAYANRQGNWPASSVVPGGIPPGMESSLSGTGWTAPSPIGGQFVWLVDTLQCGERIPAAIAIVTAGNERVSNDKRQLDELTRLAAAAQIDVHRLRLGFRREPILVLEE